MAFGIQAFYLLYIAFLLPSFPNKTNFPTLHQNFAGELGQMFQPTANGANLILAVGSDNCPNPPPNYFDIFSNLSLMVPPSGHQNRSVNLDSSNQQLSDLSPTAYLEALGHFLNFLKYGGEGEDEKRLVGLLRALSQHFRLPFLEPGIYVFTTDSHAKISLFEIFFKVCFYQRL